MHKVPCLVADAATRFGDAPALVDSQRSLTYREYYDTVTHVAAQLAGQGVRPGSRIGILLENRFEYPILILALIRIGAVACPLNWRMPHVGLSHMLRIAGCRHVIVDSRRTEDSRELGTPVVDVRTLQFVSDGDSEADPIVDLDSPATVIFTSGSTGEPKAALHTYGNHYFNALGSNENILFGPGDGWGLSLPLYHVGGLSTLFRALLGGGSVRIVPSTNETGPDWLNGITHLSLVSTQLQRLLDTAILNRTSAARLKAILLGGSSIPDRLINRAGELGLPLFRSYGLTEMGSQVTTTCPADLPKRILSSGKLLNHRELMIASDHEILVRGETLFHGYLSGDSVTRPIDGEGWFHTGDLGSLDSDGYLTVIGRKDNMFISGGENIQPEEIERALMQIEGVASAIVVPVPDEKWGYRPVAFVEMIGGAAIMPDKLTEQLRRTLPGYKVPERFLPFPAEGDQAQLKLSRARLTSLARYPAA